MGQFSVEKPVAPGSTLSGNQQYTLLQFMFVLTERFTLKMFHIRIARDAVPPSGLATSETEVSQFPLHT